MLYFSKFKIIAIYIIILFLTGFSTLNFFNNKNNILLSKNINLGLDLQGGSYLLLEVDSEPVIKQYLQNKLISLRKILKEKKIKYENLKISENTIKFIIKNNQDIQNFESFFIDKKNLINPYYDKYKSYELDYSINNNLFKINYSKYGIIEIKNTTLNQSLEIVRRRIDEVGTNDPTIIKRGNNRILVELPGLDNPNRIKELLGKTANLTFRIVANEESSFGVETIFMKSKIHQKKLAKE